MDRYRDPVQIIEYLVRKFTRYHVGYVGEVIDDRDELNRGRVLVQIDELGWGARSTAAWCWPRSIHGLSVPKVGEKVEVSFVSGSRDRPVYSGIAGELAGQKPAAFSSKTTRVIFQDPDSGDSIVYDAQAKRLTITVQGTTIIADGDKIELKAKGNTVLLESSHVTVNGNLEVLQ